MNLDLDPGFWPILVGSGSMVMLLILKKMFLKKKLFLKNNKKIMVLKKFLKGQSKEIFDLHFFSSFEPVWVTDQWVGIFTILVEIFEL